MYYTYRPLLALVLLIIVVFSSPLTAAGQGQDDRPNMYDYSSRGSNYNYNQSNSNYNTQPYYYGGDNSFYYSPAPYNPYPRTYESPRDYEPAQSPYWFGDTPY